MEYVVVEDQAMQALINESPDMLDEWMEDEVCARIVEEIQASFNTSPPGVRYSYGVASLPGYPPNDYTGELKESYHYSKSGGGEYIIADGVPYGVYLEYGTSKMQARPHVGPVIQRWQRGALVRSFVEHFGGPGGKFTTLTARYARMRR